MEIEKYKPFAQRVDIKEKEIIWNLYFNKLYSYAELEKHFKGKYTYSQLKSIIIERYKMYGETE